MVRGNYFNFRNNIMFGAKIQHFLRFFNSANYRSGIIANFSYHNLRIFPCCSKTKGIFFSRNNFIFFDKKFLFDFQKLYGLNFVAKRELGSSSISDIKFDKIFLIFFKALFIKRKTFCQIIFKPFCCPNSKSRTLFRINSIAYRDNGTESVETITEIFSANSFFLFTHLLGQYKKCIFFDAVHVENPDLFL